MAEWVAGAAPAAPVRLRRNWVQRLALELAALVAALAMLAAVALVLVDTDPGHRWVADRLARLETASGLRIRIGRIEGSLFGAARLRNVAVADDGGVFLTAPEVRLDWAPGAWLYNSLHIDLLAAPRVTLVRLPRLRATPPRRGPLLPDFDIHVGRLRVDRLELLAAVTGTPRRGRVEGSVEIRAGRAMIALDAALDRGGDRLAARLDAEPERDRFDLGVRLAAPANGLVPTMLGWRYPLDLRIVGDGSWSRWRGSAALDLAERPTARLALAADGGRYRLAGGLAPSRFLTGKLQRLTSPVIRVAGHATLAERQLQGQLTLASAALRAVAAGTVDLARSRYSGLRLGVDLLRPPALFPNMRGQRVRLVWTLDGPFATADYAYRLTSPQLAFDATGFRDVRAEGRGRLSRWPMRLPVRVTARAVTGVGEVAGAILANVRIQGVLTVTPRLVRGDRLELTSSRLKGRLSLLLDLVSGEFDILLSGGMNRYLIPGLGIVDVTSELHVVPGPGGRGTRVVGTGKAWVRRLDNAFFRSLTGGLPRLETRLERLPDGVLRFTGLQLQSPTLRLSGTGLRRRDGSFYVEARGSQSQYGPLQMVLDGPIERPRIDLRLERPNAAMGLRDVRLQLAPTAAGFDYRAAGGSTLGPFTSSGQILLPSGGRARIAVAALDVADTRAAGELQSDPGGFTGRLALAGSLAGELLFSPAGEEQRIEAHLTAADARFPDAGVAVRRARLDGTILLGEDGTSIAGVVDARGLDSSGFRLARLTANARLRDGIGQVRAAVAGERGSDFAFSSLADISPDRLQIRGNGRIGRKPLQLLSPAVFTREAGGWRVASTRLRFGGGQATVGGRIGDRPELSAELAAMPLELLDVLSPGLGLGGTANGRIDYRWGSGRPSGRADLRLRGVSRAGLLLASAPVDLGIAAVVDGGNAAIRAVAASGGRTVGRAQARLAPLADGPLAAALLNAPLFAQLRYAGPADTLWRLTGVELIDLSGPVAIGADVRGSWANPLIRGSIRAQDARLSSAVTGMAVDGLAAAGSFTGSRLFLSSVAGRTAGGGSLAGRGSIDLSAGSPTFDLAFTTARARLLDRDDILAEVSGPLTIRSDGQGGTIAGQLQLDRGRFRLGRASAAAAVPRLAVRETGREEDEEVIAAADLKPWRLAIDVGGDTLEARGLGIDSLWRTRLRVGGTADAPRFTGRADLVRGDYEFAGRNFRLDRGTIRFSGESPVNPQLDIRASAELQGLDASVQVGGTGLRPEISFASVPAMPQDELLSRLLFGTSITNLSAPEALQLASAVTALQSGDAGLDPINAVRRAAGLDRLRILPADIAAGRGTAVSAGKYLGRKLFVEVVTDGQGYSATRVEYQVTRWLSLLSSVSTVGRTGANVRVSKDY